MITIWQITHLHGDSFEQQLLETRYVKHKWIGLKKLRVISQEIIIHNRLCTPK